MKAIWPASTPLRTTTWPIWTCLDINVSRDLFFGHGLIYTKIKDEPATKYGDTACGVQRPHRQRLPYRGHRGEQHHRPGRHRPQGGHRAETAS
ncbi:MAG: hypothetical protein M0C28_36055 [Candidatus Moduliflexus flocculans]|nr:hypothetical protein [Candidatus Moduliflexus flocculans]